MGIVRWDLGFGLAKLGRGSADSFIFSDSRNTFLKLKTFFSGCAQTSQPPFSSSGLYLSCMVSSKLRTSEYFDSEMVELW